MLARLFLCLALVPLAVACGGPVAGTSCDTVAFACQDAQSVLECRGGTWTVLPCRGPNGCRREGDSVACDMRNSLAGDACASTAEGKGLCEATGAAILECRAGAFVKTNCPRGCTTSGETVVCQQ